MEILKYMRILGDPGRVRILRMLSREELSVAELTEILGTGQSTISMQLSQLKTGGLVEQRKSGTKSLYRAVSPAAAEPILREALQAGVDDIPEILHDDEALNLVLERRKDHLRNYFDELAGRFGRNYVPGRSWKALSEMLIRLLPPLVIADLGAGEGTLSLMLAQSASKVISVDNSSKMVEYGREVASRNGLTNIEYRQGDMESIPIEDGEVDIVLFHQSLHHAMHPQRALNEAARILKPGGRVLVLDLLKHDIEAARELYADVWLGFSRVDLLEMLRTSGFEAIDISVVDRATEPPHFESLMAIALKARHEMIS